MIGVLLPSGSVGPFDARLSQHIGVWSRCSIAHTKLAEILAACSLRHVNRQLIRFHMQVGVPSGPSAPPAPRSFRARGYSQRCLDLHHPFISLPSFNSRIVTLRPPVASLIPESATTLRVRYRVSICIHYADPVVHFSQPNLSGFRDGERLFAYALQNDMNPDWFAQLYLRLIRGDCHLERRDWQPPSASTNPGWPKAASKTPIIRMANKKSSPPLLRYLL